MFGATALHLLDHFLVIQSSALMLLDTLSLSIHVKYPKENYMLETKDLTTLIDFTILILSYCIAYYNPAKNVYNSRLIQKW